MKLRFNQKYYLADTAYTFVFDALEPVEWQAGQSVRIELPAGWGTEERRFTICSAPFERHIAITTRVSNSDFKQALAALQPGDEVNAYDIRGDFTWQNERVVFCASGIGVTPFVAMLRQQKHEGLSLAATFLYACKGSRPLFVDEFKHLEQEHPALKLVLIADRQLTVADILPHADSASVYLAGPSGMVRQLAAELQEQGIAEGQLKSDWFTGRAGWEK